MKKSLSYLACLAVALIGVVGYSLFFPTVDQPQGATYYLKPGASKKAVLAELYAQGLIRSTVLLNLYTYSQSDSTLKTGEYLFPAHATPVSIWKQITTGKGLVYHPFTIIPGWTFKQLRQALEKITDLRHSVMLLDDKQVMQKLGQETVSPEGQFFPDTYYYTKGISDWTILKRAYQLMQIKLQAAWLHRDANLPYKSEYEALIAASLVEKEAYLAIERPLIAGVLINRIRKGMLLQFDPTIIYGLGDRYNGKIYKQDLIQDTAYNTYLHKGLPPTPIAMPSLASIDAAMHPAQHDFYYFVAKGNGAHQFSHNLTEHNAAVSSVRKPVSYYNELRIKTYLLPYFSSGLSITL